MNKNVHPVATLFPLLEGKELIALAEDIRWNGLREPIKRWNDMIIDGRNRAKACELANAEPRYEDRLSRQSQRQLNTLSRSTFTGVISTRVSGR